jgi:hypothetical protein
LLPNRHNLMYHLDNFHLLWTRTAKRTMASQHTVAKAMRPIFESDEVKGSFFLTILPDTMDNVIDILSTQGLPSFTAIKPKFQDIAEKHSIEVESPAYYARPRPQPQATRSQPARSQPQRSQSQGQSAPVECTWCKKRDLPAAGHTYRDCRKLKAHQENSSSGQPSRKKHREQGHTATTLEDNEDSSTEVNAFAAVANLNSKRGRLVSITTTSSPLPEAAFSLSALTSAASPHSLLDSGASRYMSGNLDDFSSVDPQTG